MQSRRCIALKMHFTIYFLQTAFLMPAPEKLFKHGSETKQILNFEFWIYFPGPKIHLCITSITYKYVCHTTMIVTKTTQITSNVGAAPAF
jgi:hypothetical protein